MGGAAVTSASYLSIDSIASMFPGPGSLSALCGAGAGHTSLPAIDPGVRLLLTARSLPHSATGFRVGCHLGDVALLSLWVTNGADLWNTSASPLN